MDRTSTTSPAARGDRLTGSDRRHLRSLAHADPVVQIGADGVTPGVLAALDRALSDHELVKVRIARERDERGDRGALAADAQRGRRSVGRRRVYARARRSGAASISRRLGAGD
jgi:RNA-binding protein